MVESEKFDRIQEFPEVRYKILAGSAGAVWYKDLGTVFIFEHIVSVTSLLGFQTKQKVAIKTAFYKYCKIIWNSNWDRYTGKTVQKTKIILFPLILAIIIFCKPKICEGV